MTMMPVRDVSLFVEVIGDGYPLALMHGGPGGDHWTLRPLRRLADEFTLVFYDHRCNGRSVGMPVESMTFDNLTADADALRERLGFGRWAVLGHSFGGQVALEYALRYPERVSHLLLLDTGADSRWSQNAPAVLAQRGFSSETVELARRWFSGQIEPREMFPTLMRLGSAYNPHTDLPGGLRLMFDARHSKLRPEAEIFWFTHAMRDWSVVDRLGEIAVPTLVMAGRDDFVFPPECQQQLAEGIAGARLRLIDRAGHNPQDEQTDDVIAAVRDFLRVPSPVLTA